MTSSHDRSYKDQKYFIDDSVYNCPFCNRRNVRYLVTDYGSFNSSHKETIHYYLVRCEDCDKISFHLSEYELKTNNYGGYREKKFAFPPKQITQEITISPYKAKEVAKDILDEDGKPQELDDIFFYSLPTAFFTIDERIPKTIREPLSESDNSLKSNFLTGASGCLRKAIYKLLKHEGIPEMNQQKNTFLKHDERMELLKQKHPEIDGALLDELKAVHSLTSQELHEKDWEDFSSADLRFLLGVTKEILIEMYVIPDENIKRRQAIAELKKKANPSNV